MVAVIILNWNGEALLDEFLPQVLENTAGEDATVMVADNGSTDGSLALLRHRFPQVPVMAFDKNYGFAGGYNKAIGMLDAREYPLVVLLNSDVAPAPGWLCTLTRYMNEHPQVGACQPKILNYKARDTFEYAGASGGYLDKHGYPYCRGRIMNHCEKDHGQYDTVAPVFWASGAALMVRTELYRRVGGLDEAFFAHMEEIDLCWRILLTGSEIMAVPQSVVYHLGGASLPASNPRKTYLNFRNSLLMLHKNLPDATRRRKLFVRRLLDTLAWAKFVATLDFANARAIVRAHCDFRAMRSSYTTHPAIDLLDTRPDTHLNLILTHLLHRRPPFPLYRN